MNGLIVVALLMAAQGVAAVVMVYAGRVLQVIDQNAGWLEWTVVGGIGITASVLFLQFVLNPRWSQWPR